MVVRCDDGRSARASHALLAIGSIPNSDGLGLDAAGVEVDGGGYVPINHHCQSNVAHIYAAGDVSGKLPLSSVAAMQGRKIAEHVMGLHTRDHRHLDYDKAASAIFTEPEIADVGLAEAEAFASGRKIRVTKVPFSASAKALIEGDPRGFVKIVSDPATGVVLGGSIVGRHAAELISVIALAVTANLKVTDIVESPPRPPRARRGAGRRRRVGVRDPGGPGLHPRGELGFYPWVDAAAVTGRHAAKHERATGGDACEACARRTGPDGGRRARPRRPRRGDRRPDRRQRRGQDDDGRVHPGPAPARRRARCACSASTRVTQAEQLRPLIGSQLQDSALPDRLRVGEALDLFATSRARDGGELLEQFGLARAAPVGVRLAERRGAAAAVPRARPAQPARAW